MGYVKIEKKSQLERIKISQGLISNLIEEVRNGEIDSNAAALQEAVYLQQDINRLVEELKRAFYGY